MLKVKPWGISKNASMLLPVIIIKQNFQLWSWHACARIFWKKLFLTWIFVVDIGDNGPEEMLVVNLRWKQFLFRDRCENLSCSILRFNAWKASQTKIAARFLTHQFGCDWSQNNSDYKEAKTICTQRWMWHTNIIACKLDMCCCMAPQIETPIYTRRTATHQLLWQQQHTCGAVGGSSMERGVGGQPHKAPHFYPRHRHPPTRNDPPKKSLGPA